MLCGNGDKAFDAAAGDELIEALERTCFGERNERDMSRRSHGQRLCDRVGGADPERLDDFMIVDRDVVATWIAKLAPLTAAERHSLYPAIESGRAALIVGGAIVLLAALDALYADGYVASERDILHGLVLGLAS